MCCYESFLLSTDKHLRISFISVHIQFIDICFIDIIKCDDKNRLETYQYVMKWNDVPFLPKYITM